MKFGTHTQTVSLKCWNEQISLSHTAYDEYDW